MTHENVAYWAYQLRSISYTIWYDDLVIKALAYLESHQEVYGDSNVTTRKTREIGNDLMGLLN